MRLLRRSVDLRPTRVLSFTPFLYTSVTNPLLPQIGWETDFVGVINFQTHGRPAAEPLARSFARR